MNMTAKEFAALGSLVEQRLTAWDRLMEVHQAVEWIDDDGNAIEICMECCVVDVDEDGEPCERVELCELGEHEHAPERPVCRSRAVLQGVER